MLKTHVISDRCEGVAGKLIANIWGSVGWEIPAVSSMVFA
jgi:hypothetical protein